MANGPVPVAIPNLARYKVYKITVTEIMRLSTMSTRSDTMRRRASAALYINDLVRYIIQSMPTIIVFYKTWNPMGDTIKNAIAGSTSLFQIVRLNKTYETVEQRMNNVLAF